MGQIVQYLLRKYTYTLITKIKRSLHVKYNVITNFRYYVTLYVQYSIYFVNIHIL
jgi:hypothetical protein